MLLVAFETVFKAVFKVAFEAASFGRKDGYVILPFLIDSGCDII